jgi:hypothetical protein
MVAGKEWRVTRWCPMANHLEIISYILRPAITKAITKTITKRRE